MQSRALVVGGDGRIARALIPALAREGWDVLATSRRPGAARIALDLAEVARTGSAQLPDCDVAFVCAAMSGYAECRNAESRARAVNAEAPALIARALAARGAQIVLLSTNGVFDGEKPFRAAADAPDGTTVYGRSKALAEANLRSVDPRAAVLRLTRVFVPGEPLLVGWAGTLRAREPVEAFADLPAAPVHVEHVVSALLAIARARSSGILQISARRQVTYVEIARHIAARVGASPDLVSPVAAASRGLGPGEAPRYASLACDEFLAGFGVAPIEPFDVVDAVLGLAR
jgi:dTDP-4-dehydrorhamnose reductase